MGISRENRIELEEFIDKTYVMKHLIRYNNTAHIKDESVIEHVGFVTLITLKLHEYYEFDLSKALTMAISHDLTEMEVTDIPHNVKRNYPELKEAIFISEDKAWDKIGNEYWKELNHEFNNESSVEGLIVQYADVLSCIQYSKSEINLGNKGYILDVYDESIVRKNEIENKLEKYKKNA